MEGYVWVKVGRKYEHSYCILEGQQLQYYEKVDVNEQVPVGSRGVQAVRDVEVHGLEERGRPNCIALVYTDGVTTVLDCQQQRSKHEWTSALTKASQLHHARDKIKAKVNLLRHRLDFAPGELLTKVKITNAYNRRSLGTSPAERVPLDEARDVLVELEERAHTARHSTLVDYEAVVEKRRGGGGLGLVVSENRLIGRLEVVGVETSILLRGLSEESGGEIKLGDVLVGIDNDNCTDWPMARVRARLGALRLPPGYTTNLTLERSIPKERPGAFIPGRQTSPGRLPDPTDIDAHMPHFRPENDPRHTQSFQALVQHHAEQQPETAAATKEVASATQEMTKLRLQLARNALVEDIAKDSHVEALEARVNDLEKSLALTRLYATMGGSSAGGGSSKICAGFGFGADAGAGAGAGAGGSRRAEPPPPSQQHAFLRVPGQWTNEHYARREPRDGMWAPMRFRAAIQVAGTPPPSPPRGEEEEREEEEEEEQQQQQEVFYDPEPEEPTLDYVVAHAALAAADQFFDCGDEEPFDQLAH